MKGYLVGLSLLLGLVQSVQYAVAQVKAQATPKASSGALTKKTGGKRRVVRPTETEVDPTAGDNVDGDDLTIRRAAVAALGTMNGSVVVADPSNGRILTMVNQKLALKSGFIPCSTIKLVTSLAALNEHVVTRETFINIGRYNMFNLTTALAPSNNEYF